MAFISVADQDHLRERFAQELVDDVLLLLFTRRPSLLFVPGREEPVHVKETQALLEELVALSPRLHLEVHDIAAEPELAAQYQVTGAPAVVALRRPPASGSELQVPSSKLGLPGPTHPPTASGTPSPRRLTPDARRPSTGLVRFIGLPAGYEFRVLIDDLVDLSRGGTSLSAATRERLNELQESLHLQVFVTPT